jgi:hypothetical protein
MLYKTNESEEFSEEEEQENQELAEVALDFKEDFEWTTEHEDILIEWADKAMCYRWLHSRANALYSSRNAWYTIPVIVISTLTGTANFAQERVPIEYQNYFVMLVGGFNILAGIITTVQQFLKITQLNEAHRVSSIAWDKFYRNIKIEIAKAPEERIDVAQMIKVSKEEFDRLMETSPTIPEQIVKSFKYEFKASDAFKLIAKPEICDELKPTDEFRNPWANPTRRAKRMKEHLQKEADKEMKKKEKDDKIKQQEIENNRIVYEFKETYYNLNHRVPLDTEIIDNLKDKIELSVLKQIVEKQKANDDNDSCSPYNRV